MVSQEEKKQLSQYLDEIKRCREWKEKHGIINRINESIDFYEGKQWADATEKTKELPRPVFNLTRLIIDNQVSNILGTPVKINFVALGSEMLTDIVTQFTDNVLKKCKFDSYKEKAVIDAETKGTGIIYTYFDDTKYSANGKYQGTPSFETIDPRNFYCSHPQIEDKEKQEWITIPVRENIDNVIAMCETVSQEEAKRLIQANKEEERYISKGELENSNNITVYTRFFKKNGEVYFIKFTDGLILHKARPINPNVTKKVMVEETKGKIKEDKPSSNMDSELETNKANKFKFNKYPFVILTTVEQDDSIFGLGTATQIIPNNKLINLTMAYNMLNTQNLAWGKILVKNGALRGQKVTNKPGQLLVDYSPMGGWGITNMPGQQTLSNGAIDQARTYLDLTRVMLNSDEIMTGDMLSKNLSGTAIAQIEAMRTKNVDRKQRKLWRFCEQIGEILYQYYVAYYNEENSPTFPYELSDRAYEEEKKTNKNAEKVIMLDGLKGDYLREYDFDIVCEAGAGSQFSEVMQMQILDSLLQQQQIDFATYVELYPQNQMPFKKRLRQIIKAQQESELEQWKQAYNELAMQTEDLQQKYSFSIEKSNAMENYANNLKKSFKEVVDGKNSQIKSMEEFMSKIKGQALDEENDPNSKGSA